MARALDAVREVLDCEHRPDHKRSWLLLSLMTAVIRGISSDSLVTIREASGHQRRRLR